MPTITPSKFYIVMIAVIIIIVIIFCYCYNHKHECEFGKYRNAYAVYNMYTYIIRVEFERSFVSARATYRSANVL